MIVSHKGHHIGAPIHGVVSVCQDWKSAEKERARLQEVAPHYHFNLIEKTLTK